MEKEFTGHKYQEAWIIESHLGGWLLHYYQENHRKKFSQSFKEVNLQIKRPLSTKENVKRPTWIQIIKSHISKNQTSVKVSQKKWRKNAQLQKIKNKITTRILIKSIIKRQGSIALTVVTENVYQPRILHSSKRIIKHESKLRSQPEIQRIRKISLHTSIIWNILEVTLQ